MRPSILVVYYHRYTYPMRKAIEDHLYAFGRYGDVNCAHVNVAFGLPPSILRRQWDLILFHTTYLAQLRWTDRPYEALVKTSWPLKGLSGVKAVLPQDEFLHADNVCRFIKDFGVTHVFSCADPAECAKIYPDVDRRKVRFHQVLTGYLDQDTLRRITQLAGKVRKRDVDIGYRAFQAPPWLGKHGLLKVKIARKFQGAADGTGLVCDISTEDRDTFLGMDWYRFMLRCRYMIGVEGGSSVLDYDGSVRRCVDKFVAAHPSSTFEVVKAACFPEKDGGLNLKAISPRHLEACATKTCQILVEGAYSGVLEPWKHYIPVKADFSDVKEVLKVVQDEVRRTEIVERAYKDVVLSGKWTYQGFVKQVLDACLPYRVEGESLVFSWLDWRETGCWLYLALEAKVWGSVKRCLPVQVTRFIRRFRRAL